MYDYSPCYIEVITVFLYHSVGIRHFDENAFSHRSRSVDTLLPIFPRSLTSSLLVHRECPSNPSASTESGSACPDEHIEACVQYFVSLTDGKRRSDPANASLLREEAKEQAGHILARASGRSMSSQGLRAWSRNLESSFCSSATSHQRFS